MQWVGVCYFLFILWWQLLCCSGSISCMWRCSAGWVSGVLPQHCSTKVTAVRTFVLQCCGSTSIMLQYEGHGSSYLHTAVLWKCFHEVAVRRSQQFVPSYFHEVAVWRSQQFVPSYCSVVEVLPWRCSTKVTAVRSLATILQLIQPPPQDEPKKKVTVTDLTLNDSEDEDVQQKLEMVIL